MISQFINAANLSIPRSFTREGVVNRAAMYRHLVDNGILRENDTREIDEALVRVARRDLRAVARLRQLGLVKPLKNIGITSYEYDRITPVGPASQSMSILDIGEADLITFGRTAIPVPVTASQFKLDARQLAGGQATGGTIDTTNVEEHTRAVAEKMEDTLVNGSNVVLGSNTLPGYTNFGARAQVSFSDTAWDQISGTPGAAITDVLNMRSALRDNGFTGPYDLYIPTNYDGVLDSDYKDFSDRTLRERLLAIDGIQSVSVLPSLPADNVLLVQTTQSVVQWADGQDITVVTWDVMGGLAMRWAIINVGAPALKQSFARGALSDGELPALTSAAGIAHLGG